jgi:hypothetical protein
VFATRNGGNSWTDITSNLLTFDAGRKTGSAIDGPYAETQDIVVGFSIIRAENFDEAAALARTRPLFDQGGMIEIRPILKGDDLTAPR